MYKFLDDKSQHLHTFDGVPLRGASTITSILAKPLTWWSAGLAMEVFGWKNGKYTSKEARLKHAEKFLDELKVMELEDYVRKLDEGYSAHSKTLNKKAKEGTDLHAELEDYVNYCLANGGKPQGQTQIEYSAKVQLFIKWAVENIKEFIVAEGHCYSDKAGVGGIFDVAMIMKDGSTAIGDFKSAKAAYYDHFIQMALYALQVEANGVYNKDGEQIHKPFKATQLITFPFGAPKFEPKVRHDIAEFKRSARACLTLYKHKQNYE